MRHDAAISTCQPNFRPAAVPVGFAASFTVEAALAFGIVLSVILAPIRFGGLEVLRPTTLVLLPCAAYLLALHAQVVLEFLRTRLGVGFAALLILLLVGHVLGHDAIEGYHAGDYDVLSWESLIGIPLVFLCGIIIGGRDDARKGMLLALVAGLAAHAVSIAIFPPAVSFREHERMAGLLTDPNILLLHIIPVFFLALGLPKVRNGIILALLGVPAVIWATLQTLSRSGLIALLAGLGLHLAALLAFSRTGRERLRVLAFIICVPVVLYVCFQKRPEFVQERVEGYVTRTTERASIEGSMLGDRMLWLREMENHTVGDHLLNPLGMGYLAFQKSNGILPHNTFVDVYIISGPVGFLIYAALFIAILVGLGRLVWRRSNNNVPTFVAVSLFTCAATELLMLFSLSVLTWKINWLILGVLAGWIMSQWNKPAEPARPA